MNERLLGSDTGISQDAMTIDFLSWQQFSETKCLYIPIIVVEMVI